MGNTKRSKPVTLVGCGILKNEISYLSRKNKWNLKAHFLCSSLHVDFDKLEKALVQSLELYKNESKIVFYGTCHPNMNRFVKTGNAVRTLGQNCVDIILGHDLFHKHLSAGAFFLMEDWAMRWNLVMTKAFGDNPAVIREIFSSEHKYLLAIRTVCSTDYEDKAQKISDEVNLPLRWLDVDLNHLESVLLDTVNSIGNLSDE